MTRIAIGLAWKASMAKLLESACPKDSCRYYGLAVEWLEHPTGIDPPNCQACGTQLKRVYSSFNMPFSGSISQRYASKTAEQKSIDGGFWAWKRRNTLSGKPERVRINTFQELNAFCKSEGVHNPTDLPQHMEIKPDGKGWSTQGMPGSWTSVPAELMPDKEPDPPPTPSRPAAFIDAP